MEDVLEVYARPYDPSFPVVCKDESSVQLIGEVQEPIPAASGHPELVDDEYVRNGVASILLEVEPLGGKRKVKITERRTRIDWAHFIKDMLEIRYSGAEKVHIMQRHCTRLSLQKKPGSWPSDLKYITRRSMVAG